MAISRGDFKKIKRSMAAEGTSETTLDKIEALFSGDLDEMGHGSGINKDELKKGEKRLEKKAYDYGISKDNIDKFKEKAKKYL